VDLVYGKITAADGSRVMIPRKTSLTFVESDRSRTNSGAVGYLKGKNLRVGTGKSKQYSTGKKEWIIEPASGFYLRGATNDGECWTDSGPNAGKERYYDDPILGFTDSMLYGCHLDLTYEELETFCKDNKYKDYEIFKSV